MKSRHKAAVFALTITVLAPLGIAQAQPGRTPDDVLPALERMRDEPKSKSDAYRLVGKVVALDKERGVVKLETDTEGVREVKPHAMLLRAVRVGDTISVVRPDGEGASASPR